MGSQFGEKTVSNGGEGMQAEKWGQPGIREITFSFSHRKEKEKDQDRKWGPAMKPQSLLLVVYFYF